MRLFGVTALIVTICHTCAAFYETADKLLTKPTPSIALPAKSHTTLSLDTIRQKAGELYHALQSHVAVKGNTYTIRIDQLCNFTINNSGRVDMSQYETQDDDVFCNILSGKAPGRFIFQDSEFVCLLKRRTTNGYVTTSTKESTDCLIIPRKHTVEAHTLSLPLFTALIINGFRAGTYFGGGDTYILEINNGSRQGIQHVHLHSKIQHNPPLTKAVQDRITDGELLPAN